MGRRLGKRNTGPAARAGVLLAIMGLAATLGMAAAFASHGGPNPGSLNNFDIDGDFMAATGGTGGIDWENVGDVTRITDAAASEFDDIFGGGSKEQEPDTWTYATKKAPGKADLQRVYIAQDIAPTEARLYLASELIPVQGQGDTHNDFEFNQNSTTETNSKGVEVVERKDGDLLFIADHPGGTAAVALEIRRWNGVPDDPTTPGTNEEALFGVWETVTLPAGSWFADINGTDVSRPDLPGDFPDDPFGGGTVADERFLEIAADVSTIFGPDFLDCPGFSTFSAKTRTSGESFNANMADRASTMLDFSTCGSVTIHKTDDKTPPNTLDGATFGLYRDAANFGTFDGDPIDPLVATCVTGEEGTAGQCTFEQVDEGDYFVKEISAPDGYTVDPDAVFVTVGFREDVDVATAFVDHKLEPNSELHKAVRNVTDGGAFATSAAADPGETIEYQLTYHNHGDGVANDVTITDEIPEFTTFTGTCSDSCSSTGTAPGDDVSWDDIGDVPAGETRVRTYQVQIDATFNQNQITIDNVAGGSDHKGSFSSNETEVEVTALPEFESEKVASPTEVNLSDDDPTNDSVTYTVTIRNIGEGPGSDTATDNFDEDHLEITANPDGGVISDPPDTITFTSGTLDPGQEQSFSYTGTITGPFNADEDPEGDCDGDNVFPVINNVTLASGGAGSDATVCVTALPEFDVEKVASQTEVNLSDGDATNDTVTYTLTVTNIGQGPGSTPASDNYDQNHLAVDDASISDGGTDDGDFVKWTAEQVGLLNPTESNELSYSGTIFGPFNADEDPDGDCEGDNVFPVLNSVTVDGDDDGAKVCVTALPVFEVDKVALPTEINLSDGDTSNDEVTYTVTIRNIGEGPGSDTATDNFDEDHLEITDAGGGTISDPADTITFTSDVLNPGDDQTFEYTGLVTGPFNADEDPEGDCPGDNVFPVFNSVTLTSGDDTADATVCVTALPDSELTKSVRNITDGGEEGPFGDGTAADPGETLEYRLVYENNGQGPATGVTVTDPVPAHTSFLSCEPILSCSESGGTITWNLGTVDPGGSVTLSFRVLVLNDVSDGITIIPNNGSVDTDQEDPENSNEVLVSVTILDKIECPTGTVPPGGDLDYTIPSGVHGRGVTNVRFVDHLPDGFVFESASPEPTSVEGNDLVWEFAEVAAGTTFTFEIEGHAAGDLENGTVLENVVELSADGVPVKSDSVSVTVDDTGATSDANAFGLEAHLLNNTLEHGPAPDTDDPDADEQLGIHQLAPTVDVSVLKVEESQSETETSRTANAIATVEKVSVDAGGQTILAEGIVSRSSSTASIGGASSSSSGSTIKRAVINGDEYLDVDGPLSVVLTGPGGGRIGEVHLLEEIPTGAANGIPQPNGSSFESGLVVNGVHVILDDLPTPVVNEASVIIVAHSATSAAFPTGLDCDDQLAAVAGNAFAVGTTAGSIPAGTGGAFEPAFVDQRLSEVNLPITGGEVDNSIANPDLPIGSLAAASASANGTLDPLAASAVGEIHGADLLGGDITATTVRAESDTDGDDLTTIEHLEILGTDVCDTLGLEETCVPDANTVLLLDDGTVLVLLNEQNEEDPYGGTRVNGVHIFVIGVENDLGLPVGAEIVLASAHAGATEDPTPPADGDGAEGPEVVVDPPASIPPGAPAVPDAPTAPDLPDGKLATPPRDPHLTGLL